MTGKEWEDFHYSSETLKAIIAWCERALEECKDGSNRKTVAWYSPSAQTLQDQINEAMEILEERGEA